MIHRIETTMNSVVNCIGPSGVTAELLKLSKELGVSVFKLEVDESCIFMSVDVVPGNAISRHATYRPYVSGQLSAAFVDVSDWLRRVVRNRR
jgi:hypothetical protein